MARQESDQIHGVFRDYVLECFRRMGKSFDKCEQCGVIDKLIIHHTKYDDATVYDLQLVCYKCNLAPGNILLL